MKEEPVTPNTPDASSDLGPRLRAIRLRQGVGLRELARRLDLSPSSISQIETGKMQPSVRTLYAFAEELGVTVDEVLFASGPVAPTEQPSAGVESAAPSPGPGLAVQRAVGRPAIKLNSGGRWERPMLWSEEGVEFFEAPYELVGACGPPEWFS